MTKQYGFKREGALRYSIKKRQLGKICWGEGSLNSNIDTSK